MNEPRHLLQVFDLRTHFFAKQGIVKALNGVSFSLEWGEILGLIGESGSGKSVTGLSILRLVPDPPGRIVGGAIIFQGENLFAKSEEEMRKLRGRGITMIQQNPDTSLNPVFRVGEQVAETIAIHQGLGRKDRWEKAVEMLRLVRIASPEHRIYNYPHQMSGGMRQRVAGAIALSCQASLLIADEPTTNLDMTTQMDFLRLLLDIQKETGIAILFITHDFGIVSKLCHRAAVMYAGRIVEISPTEELINRPRHPYTAALISSLPRPDLRGRRLPCIEGQPPDPVNLPPGCPFWPRCSRASRLCSEKTPEETKVGDSHYVSCLHVD